MWKWVLRVLGSVGKSIIFDCAESIDVRFSAELLAQIERSDSNSLMLTDVWTQMWPKLEKIEMPEHWVATVQYR